MNYAVIKTGGKQYKVTEGSVITIERIGSEKDEKVTFTDILFMQVNGKTTVGQPIIANEKVTGTVVKNKRGSKILVSKFKAKSKYRRSVGHRQALSEVKIDSLGSALKKSTPLKERKEVSETKKPVKRQARKTAK